MPFEKISTTNKHSALKNISANDFHVTKKAKASDVPRTFERESFDYDLQTPNLQSSAHSVHVGIKAIGKGTTTARKAGANITSSQSETRAEQEDTPSTIEVTTGDALVMAVNTDHHAPLVSLVT